jgi:AcrR family transcriptional regulator
LLSGAKDVLRRLGPECVTPESVCAAAGVGRPVFARAFADTEDCLLALFDAVTERIREELMDAHHRERCWADSVRAALTRLLAFMQQEPRLARFLILGGLSADSALVARRRRLLGELARGLDAGAPASETMPAPFGSEALVRAAASIVHARLLEDPVPPLGDLAPSLMAVLVLPFLGQAAARAELHRPVASTARSSGRLSIGEPCMRDQTVGARTGPRTAAVLAVIAATPGISNRDVAAAAGGIDESQVSKMLARLSSEGAIVNGEGAEARSRARNSWRVTAAGLRLLPASGPHRSA